MLLCITGLESSGSTEMLECVGSVDLEVLLSEKNSLGEHAPSPPYILVWFAYPRLKLGCTGFFWLPTAPMCVPVCVCMCVYACACACACVCV